ncbi:MAG: DUF3553 domain-containing protein [Phycisphaerales bacterium]|jgi:hypothetical protein
MGMTAIAFKVGDKVRSIKRPEWGEGSVLKIDAITFQGKADQQIYVRFASVGVKSLLASAADLTPADGDGGDILTAIHRPTTLRDVEAGKEGGWLGSIDRGKAEQVMTALPPAATDPFLSLRKRLENSLGLYRFEAQSGRLIDWAVAQSGMADPLSRFNRQELEQMFQRWKFELDAHTSRLLGEARREPEALQAALAKAPPAARKAVQKLQSMAK